MRSVPFGHCKGAMYMGRKIRRGRHSFSRRRRFPFKAVGMVLLCCLLVVGGIFSAKFLFDHLTTTPTNPSGTSSSPSDTSEPDTSVPDETSDDGMAGVPTLQTVRAFYLPTAAMANRTSLDTQLDAAKSAGFNGVVFDVKDISGNLYYVSETAGAVTAQNAVETAMTKAELQDLFAHLKEKGFLAMPRLYAFQDPTAARKMPEARVLLKGDPGYMWLDNTLAKGGKPWLNPYSPEAHTYLIDLAKEVSSLGAPVLLLDSVQFPNQTAQASYGTTTLSGLSKRDVLQKFVTDLSAAVGGCETVVCAPGLATFSDSTAAFGGNPLTFGAGTVSPLLMPAFLGNKLTVGSETLISPQNHPYEAVTMAYSQIHTRVQLMDTASQPALLPFLQAYDYSSAQIEEQIRALQTLEGNDTPFVLYNPTGAYDFAALQNG